MVNRFRKKAYFYVLCANVLTVLTNNGIPNMTTVHYIYYMLKASLILLYFLYKLFLCSNIPQNYINVTSKPKTRRTPAGLQNLFIYIISGAVVLCATCRW